MKSWRTTLAGVVALVVLILNGAAAVLDDDPETNPDFNAIGIAALSVGALFTRDNAVTSEEAGAKTSK